MENFLYDLVRPKVAFKKVSNTQVYIRKRTAIAYYRNFSPEINEYTTIINTFRSEACFTRRLDLFIISRLFLSPTTSKYKLACNVFHRLHSRRVHMERGMAGF